MRILTLLLLLLVTACLAAQSPTQDDLAKQAWNCKASSNKDLPALVECLIAGLPDDKQKVHTLVYWITYNIAYDVKMLRSGTIKPNEDILRNKRGVCSDYSKLFRSMCDLAGIECYLVDGYSKGLGYRPGQIPEKPDHAWNVVFIDNEPYLMDLTWASGAVDASNGKLKYVSHYEEKMIMADPTVFAERHLPADPRWQLTDAPITLERFVANEDYAAMTDGLTPTQSYADSLAAFRQLDEYSRKEVTWRSAHYFHPSHENLRIRVEELLNNATHLSRGKRIEENLIRATAYCQEAYRIAEQRTDWRKRKFYMSTANQGIKYTKYRMDNPNVKTDTFRRN